MGKLFKDARRGQEERYHGQGIGHATGTRAEAHIVMAGANERIRSMA